MTQTKRGLRASIFLCALLLVTGATAGVTVDIDKATLNEILNAVSVNRVEVPLSAENVIVVELHDLQVIGLLPATETGRRHAILTSVTVVAPDLGMRIPLKPRVALEVIEQAGVSVLEMRFEDLGLNIPLMGQINLAAMVPPMRYPATNSWMIPGARGDVPLTSRLSSIDMDQDRIRFELEIEVAETSSGSR
jgi:hypothetical protein